MDLQRYLVFSDRLRYLYAWCVVPFQSLAGSLPREPSIGGTPSNFLSATFDYGSELSGEVVGIIFGRSLLYILLDFRETKISDVSMIDILKTAMELEKFKFLLKNKIANIVPDDKDRLCIAKKTEAAIKIKGFDYKFFTVFEEAVDWLSDIS